MLSRAFRSLVGLAVALVAVAGCEQVKPPPVITAIEPARVPAGVDTLVTVRGRNFFGELDRADDGRYSAELDFMIALPAAGRTLPATFVDTHTLTLTLPADVAAGNYELAVETPSGREAVSTDKLSVAAARIVIEDEAGGNGNEVDARDLLVNGSLGLHAVSRFEADGAFIADEPVTWSVSGDAGNVDATEGSDVTFLGKRPGTAVVTATHAVFGSDDTGDLTVIAADCGGSDCIDTCHETCVGDCSLDCNSSCTCELDCAGTTGTCSASCAGQDECVIDCVDAARCMSDCAGNSVCQINNCGTAGDCSATCSGNAMCRINCADTDSCGQFQCLGSAQCLLDCTNATSCGFASCGGGQTVCPGNVIVCNRACP